MLAFIDNSNGNQKLLTIFSEKKKKMFTMVKCMSCVAVVVGKRLIVVFFEEKWFFPGVVASI